MTPGTGGSREAPNGQGEGTDKEMGKRGGGSSTGDGEGDRGGGRGSGSGVSNMGEGSLAQRKVGLDSFKIVRVIGKGSFGKVYAPVGCTFKSKGTFSGTFFCRKI